MQRRQSSRPGLTNPALHPDVRGGRGIGPDGGASPAGSRRPVPAAGPRGTARRAPRGGTRCVAPPPPPPPPPPLPAHVRRTSTEAAPDSTSTEAAPAPEYAAGYGSLRASKILSCFGRRSIFEAFRPVHADPSWAVCRRPAKPRQLQGVQGKPGQSCGERANFRTFCISHQEHMRACISARWL
jgi:hypothetical protein